MSKEIKLQDIYGDLQSKNDLERAILKIAGDLWILDFFEDQELLNIVMRN